MAGAEQTDDAPERLAWLALLAPAATVAFYLLPDPARRLTVLQFVPQAVAYLALAVWACAEPCPGRRLGLTPWRPWHALRVGVPVGLALGAVNVSVIVWGVPWLGGDVAFLRDTPHARMPLWLMVPWFIAAVAVFVEVNFRGFLLGRLRVLLRGLGPPAAAAAAVLGSALLFAFDPFMTATFRQLHWIAVWDGIVWGALTVRLGTLSVAITAHAVEVVVMYSVLKFLFA